MSYIIDHLTRQCQILAYAAITFQLLSLSKCLVKMFCGSGKSRLITATIIGHKKNLSVVVVPSLALIQQFYDEYLSPLKKPKELSKHELLNVSSKSQKDLLGTDMLTLEDIHIECTTDPVEIKRFLNSNQKSKKIICVTYQSLNVLLANLDGHILGLTLFDEAHRTASHKYKELVYGSANIEKYEKQVFLTATPINKNGITMYDRENNDMGIYGNCGTLHQDCHYTYLNGLRDDVLSLFNIRIDMFTGASETRKVSLYECIARSILATGNSRVLTFHKDVAIDSNSDTSVLRFIQNGQIEFKFVFDRICADEFPEKTGLYNKITMVGLTAGTKNKKDILTEFGKCADNEIFIVASCGTIGEGVDTKNANMTVFVDPKTSVKDIIQNIGRVCRKIPGTNRPAATVLIPVWVDMQKYRDCGDDVEKRDEVLREQLNLGEKGDYNAVLNVCAALQQEDQELYDLCLRYPSNFTEAEREHTLTKQGCRVDCAEPLDECDVEERIESGQRVEIHTNNPDEPVIIHNEDGNDSVCLYACEADEDGAKTYYPIVPIQEKEKRSRNLEAPTKTNRPRIDYHTNDEMRILWKVADDNDFSNQINSAVIECQIERLDNVEIWKNKHSQMCEFIDTNKKAPSQTAKDPTEKTLGSWINRQKRNYNAEGAGSSNQIMKNEEIWQIWTDTLADPRYKEFLVLDPDEDWKNKQKKTCEFMDTNKKAPSHSAKDPTEKTLGHWISKQKTNYNAEGASSSKCIMKNPDIWQIWTNTLADTRYKEFLKRQVAEKTAEDPVEDWKNKHAQMCEFMDTNKKAPSTIAKDPTEKTLGQWISNQKTNYNAEGASSSRSNLMKNPDIWQIWTDTLADTRYKEFLKRQIAEKTAEDPFEDWKNKQKKTCEFMDTNKKAPSKTAKDRTEKTLGSWIGTQKQNYNAEGTSSSNQIMKNPDIWQIWTNTLADPRYKEFLKKGGARGKTNISTASSQVSSRSSSPVPTVSTEPTVSTVSTEPTVSSPKPAPKSHILPTPNESKITQVNSLENVIDCGCQSYDCLDCSDNLETLPVICDKPYCKNREKSEYQKIGTSWAIQKSTTTHDYLSKHPEQWKSYHDARDFSFKGYTDQSQIPRNRIITHLEKKAKHKLRILDLGCGRNYIASHFHGHAKINVIGYDHVVENGSGARVGNIVDLRYREDDENTDMCVYSQSLMGTDKMEYLREGYRMLRYGGEMIICDSVSMLEDVQTKLQEIGMKVEELEHNESRWFMLCARKC
jgi:superfamily II DNA or RNA helicase